MKKSIKYVAATAAVLVSTSAMAVAEHGQVLAFIFWPWGR